MKRFHVHVAVHDLEKSIRFYSIEVRESKSACCAPAAV
jgi:hypothetical protein